MEIFAVTYVHSGWRSVYSHVRPFTDEKSAVEEFKRERLEAIKDARDEDEDSDEKSPRDYKITFDTPNRFVVNIFEADEVIEVKLLHWTIGN